MSYELEIKLGYGAGQLEPRFEGDDYPDNWNDTQHSARMRVQERLFEIADIHEWRESFETAQEYSMPGMSPEPIVGSLHVSENGEFTVELDIDSIHDCNWDGH